MGASLPKLLAGVALAVSSGYVIKKELRAGEGDWVHIMGPLMVLGASLVVNGLGLLIPSPTSTG